MLVVTPLTSYAEENASQSVEEIYLGAFDLSKAPATFFVSQDHSQVQISKESDMVSKESVSFAFSDFERYNKGTNKDFEGRYEGYRYPNVSEDAFSVLVCEGYTLVYIPRSCTDKLSIDINNEQFQQDFLSLLQKIDESASRGGEVQSSKNQPYVFTQENTVKTNDYLYCFNKKLGQDYYYSSVYLPDSQDGSSGAIYAESAKIIDAKEANIAPPATVFESIGGFLNSIDYRPLWVSMKTSGTALFFIFILGLLAAWATIKSSNRFKGIFDTIFTIPMVLPPTVCGFLLLMLFGTSTDAGKWLIDHGIDIVFTWPAAVIACVVVGFPLMYRTARGAFENLDPNMLDAARTLGWSESKIFIQLMLPLAWPSIAAGTILAFARAMGEFGATLFFAGNYAGITQTIPLAIYFQWMGGNTDIALFWVIVVIAISFLVIMLINRYSSRTQRYRKGGQRELKS